MSYLVLARKYRPQTFSEVVQQEHIVKTLTHAIAADRMVHAVLFCGPRGTGKTTVARILAKAMNCAEGPTPAPCNSCLSCREITNGNAVDVYEIDGASNNSVDQVRELRENLRYMPAHSHYKIYIIDEVHMLSVAAFNALLKTLEEPPAHVMFIFATTEPHKIPTTILSRCQRHDFRRIGIDALTAHMETIGAKEGIEVPVESLRLIAREAGGSMRDALSLLDQVMACTDTAADHAGILDLLGILDRKIIFDLSAALLRRDVPALLEIVDETYAKGHDMKRLYADLVQQARDMMIVKMGANAEKLVELPAHELDRMRSQVADVSALFLNQVFDLLFKEELTVKISAQPKLALEMVLLKLFQIQPALPIEELIAGVDALQKAVNAAAPPAAGPASASAEPRRPASAARPPAVAEAVNAFGQDADGAGDAEATWKRLLDIIAEESPALATSLASSVLKRMTATELEVEVNGNGFNLNLIKRKKNMEILNRVFERFFGQKRKILVTGRPKAGVNNPAKKDMENRLRQEALNHSLVADAIEIFNGRVAEVKIL